MIRRVTKYTESLQEIMAGYRVLSPLWISNFTLFPTSTSSCWVASVPRQGSLFGCNRCPHHDSRSFSRLTSSGNPSTSLHELPAAFALEWWMSGFSRLNLPLTDYLYAWMFLSKSRQIVTVIIFVVSTRWKLLHSFLCRRFNSPYFPSSSQFYFYSINCPY